MRFLYVDESGNSPDKPLLVVVGLLVSADIQWQPLAASVIALRSVIPNKFMEGFEFHASEIWGADKYRQIDENGIEEWPKANRIAYLMAMMELPKKLGIPIFYAMQKRNSVKDIWGGELPSTLRGKSPEDHLHAKVFGACVCHADNYLVRFSPPREVAIIVSEEVSSRKDQLRGTIAVMVHLPFKAPFIGVGGEDILVDFHVRRFVDTVYYAQKNGSVILEIVDACAYGIYRFLQPKTELDEQFGEAIFGKEITKKIIRATDNLIGSYCSRREADLK